MRLMIKQRVFAWTDTYDIYDEYGNPKYFVKTEFFNIGHHMHIYVYLLDEKLQMEKIGTVSANLAQVIAEAAVEMPYRKAAELISQTTGQTISSHGGICSCCNFRFVPWCGGFPISSVLVAAESISKQESRWDWRARWVNTL